MTSPRHRRAALKAAGWVRHSCGPTHTESWTNHDHHQQPVTFTTAWRTYQKTHEATLAGDAT